MDLGLNGKVVIVTGGSKGIGEGVVRVFHREGARVVFCGRGASVGKALEAELNGKGPGETLFVTADVSKTEDLDALLAAAVTKYGR